MALNKNVSIVICFHAGCLNNEAVNFGPMFSLYVTRFGIVSRMSHELNI